jgi:hypothetical protein
MAIVAAGVAFGLLGLDAAHAVSLVTVLAVANALLGMALGLFLSAFARTECGAVQFMPALVIPQLLVCGLFVDRARDGGLAAGGLRRSGARVRLRLARARGRELDRWARTSRATSSS